MSIWMEFQPLLGGLLGRSITVSYDDWRPGDQHVYISDIRKAQRDLGWQPHVGVDEGVRRLYEWVISNQGLFE
jgi:CDP-paratose 2-epimerase